MDELAARNGAADGGLEGREEGGATSGDTERNGVERMREIERVHWTDGFAFGRVLKDAVSS